MFGRKKRLPLDAPGDMAAPQSNRLAPRSPSDAIKPMAAPPPPPRARKPRGGFISAFSGFLTLLIAVACAVLFGVIYWGWTNMGAFTQAEWFKFAAWGVVQMAVASVAGAWLYREAA
jgi:hypothetical protein